ncbi:HIT family protein [Streptomyces sp. NPDC058861]|uniref:HIT family protein n=1 Tax=Streptomyces sp. NPDC058861 TaxID=3346653 RepID=UPI0036828630
MFEIPPEVLAVTTALVQRVAEAARTALNPSGVNILSASGPGSEQSVPHLHFHVVPRWVDDGILTSRMWAWAVVEEPGHDRAQNGGLAAAGVGAGVGVGGDQDVRGVVVQVDGDGLASGAEADERGGLGHGGEQVAHAGVGQAERGGRAVLLLDQDVGVASGQTPGEGGVLQGEFLHDELGGLLPFEAQVDRQADADLRVVGEVDRDVG